MANALIKFVESVCVQTAVYWGSPTPDGYGGYTYDDPIEISCRWEEKAQLVVTKDGKEVVSKGEILVTRDLDIDGMLYLGTLDDIDSDGSMHDEAVPIITKTAIPLFKSSTEFVRMVYV